MEAQSQTSQLPKLLFVDDEKRVLNSMRAMFRRNFDLYLASHGGEALDIVKDQDIDVIVADHRMPQMTGVEVLSAVRALSPRTVRILLTGYADLDAVEGSINEGEVFRFLTKPCPPQQLRETIELAAKVARQTPAPQDAAPTEIKDEEGRDPFGDTIEIILDGHTATEVTPNTEDVQPAARPGDPVTPDAGGIQHLRGTADTDIIEKPRFEEEEQAIEPAADATPPAASKPRLAAGLGVVVFSNDADVLATVQQAVRGRLPVHQATNIVKVVKILNQHRPGVLVTDISEDRATIQAMTARLKDHLPELITIAVSQHRDVLDMVWLINHGQIFRFLRKPLSPGRCAVSLQAALQHHRMLLKNPELVKRHEVDSAEDTGMMDGVLEKLRSVKRLWASA